jgi:hypothetical protein
VKKDFLAKNFFQKRGKEKKEGKVEKNARKNEIKQGSAEKKTIPAIFLAPRQFAQWQSVQ